MNADNGFSVIMVVENRPAGAQAFAVATLLELSDQSGDGRRGLAAQKAIETLNDSGPKSSDLDKNVFGFFGEGEITGRLAQFRPDEIDKERLRIHAGVDFGS